MNIRKLEDLSKDELIDLIKQEPWRGELLSALTALVNALQDRHYGRMPDEVQSAYDRAWSVVYASPQPLGVSQGAAGNQQILASEQDGMTLRDYFAAQVIGPAFLDLFTGWRQRGETVYEDWPMGLAIDAYRVADAMLAQRENKS